MVRWKSRGPQNRWSALPAFETRCHSEPFAVILSEAKDLALGAQGKLREESRPGLLGAVFPTQIEIPRFARNDISWFLSARQPTGMSTAT